MKTQIKIFIFCISNKQFQVQESQFWTDQPQKPHDSSSSMEDILIGLRWFLKLILMTSLVELNNNPPPLYTVSKALSPPQLPGGLLEFPS